VTDPDGMFEDDYTVDRDGTFHLVRKTDDSYDRILNSDRTGEIKRKGEGFLGFLVPQSKRGQPKVIIDN